VYSLFHTKDQTVMVDCNIKQTNNTVLMIVNCTVEIQKYATRVRQTARQQVVVAWETDTVASASSAKLRWNFVVRMRE
jgi:hypothetical protein